MWLKRQQILMTQVGNNLPRRDTAFGSGGHFCFGAPLARTEGQIAFATLLRDASDFALDSEPLVWRENTGLRGLTSLPVIFGRSSGN